MWLVAESRSPALAKRAILRPSGDQAGHCALPSASDRRVNRRSPDPSALTRMMAVPFGVSPRPVKAIRLESGDHWLFQAIAEARGMRFASEPSAAAIMSRVSVQVPAV